jgi:hypothetical protein
LRPECVLFQFTVNGKTGTRSLGLMESMPYVLDWLDKHPEKANKDAYLFSSYTKVKRGKSTSSRISTGYVCWIYTRRYRLEYFPKLLDDPNVPQQDKDIIKVMLQERRWNPYALRHFSLTDKTKQRLMSDGMLRQHAGWTKNSKMPSVYYHFYGNEAVDELYKAKGYLQKDDIYDSNPIGLKKCPMCGYNNLPESLSCVHCKLLIDQVAFKQIMEDQYIKDTKLEEMTRQLQEMKENERKHKEEMDHIRKIQMEINDLKMSFTNSSYGKKSE